MSPAEASEAPLCLAPRPPGRRPAHPLPPGTVDAHLHVFREGAVLASPRSYTPRIATLADWLAFADAFGIAKGVLVQPSVYGLDNTVLIEALRAAPRRLRAVAVIVADAPEAEIRRLDRAGVRGIRINVRNKSGLGLGDAEALAKRIAPFGWVLQLQVGPAELELLEAVLPRLHVPLVFDHLGFLPLDAARRAGSIETLRRLADRPNVHLKTTAPYRLDGETGFPGFRAVVRELATSHPEKLLWGSDWPHTELFDAMPEEADLADLGCEAIGGNALEAVMACNAEALFFEH